MSKYKQETVAGEQKVIQTFIIRNKETKEIWTARSGKSSWKKPNHAKNAFAGNDFENKRDPLLKKEVLNLGKYDKIYFDDQDVYEIIELVPESKVVVEESIYTYTVYETEWIHDEVLDVKVLFSADTVHEAFDMLDNYDQKEEGRYTYTVEVSRDDRH